MPFRLGCNTDGRAGSTPGALSFCARRAAHYGSLTPVGHQCLNPSPSPYPHRRGLWENEMPTDIRARVPGPGTQLVGLLASIRWEAQFTLAKCCMRASSCGRMLPADLYLVFRCTFCPILSASRFVVDAAGSFRAPRRSRPVAYSPNSDWNR
jgi:hypothetical protein